MDQRRLRVLFDKYIDRQCSASELEELVTILQQADAEDILTEPMEILWEELKQDPKQYPVNWDIVYKNVMQAENRPATILFLQKSWWIAASIVMVLGIGALLLFNQKPKIQLATEEGPIIKTDVAPPGSSHAIITLANGQTIILDSVKNGSIAKQGNVNLVKLADGKLVYNQAPGPDSYRENSGEMTYNTITVPRGSQVVSLTLADGSKVWMNAASSMRYPTSFIGNERKVEITGEAYFEVAKDATKKFIVAANGVSTEVLGTHFNVNNYGDEPDIKVTLLEGSIKVSKENATEFLKPGQQAQVSSLIKIVNDVDLDEVVAWKNGWFNFNSLQIPDIMKQVSRWYDLNVVYEGNISQKHFTGIVSRESNVSGVLKIMEEARIKFKIEGKNITVMQ